MGEKQFKLIDISSSYDPKYDHFTLKADLIPLSYEESFIISSKIISYNNDVLINTSKRELMIFESKDDVFNIYDGISGNGNINPNKFDLYYKIFVLDKKNILNLKLQGPPQLSRKGGSFIVHQPEKNFIGSNKWKFGSISIESIIIRKVDETFEMYFNLHNEDFFSSIGIIEVSGKDWSEKTEPTIPDSPKFQVTLNINEEIDNLDFDIKFMFFEVNTSEKIIDQIIPEPEIEEETVEDDDDEASEILVGKTYEISALHKKCLSEIEKFNHPDTDKTLSTEKLWRNGTFRLKVSNDEEKEEIENCKEDGGSEWVDAFFEECEITHFYDLQHEEFIFYNEDFSEDERENLKNSYNKWLENEDDGHKDMFVFLENLGYEPKGTKYMITDGIVVKKLGDTQIVDNEDDRENDQNKNDLNNDTNWEEVGERAFYKYYDSYEKSENHEEAQELADTEIGGSWWETDLDKENVVIIIQSIGQKIRDIHEEVGFNVSGELLRPMHTWLSDKLYEAQMRHDDEFEDLDRFINEELLKLLPNDDKETDTNTNVETVKKEKSDSNENNFFKHNVILVSIGKSLTENKKIYEAARYAWDAKKERAEKMDYVIAHQSGKIVGVFEPEKWLYADDKEFSNFPEADPKRIGFIGKVADSEILLEYLNKEIPSEFRPKGASNPVRYIELEKSNTKTEKKNKKSKVLSKDVKESNVKEFGWWNIHKGYDENDIDHYICEFYEIKDDLDENGEEIVDEDGYSSTQKDDGWGNLYNPKITMAMVMSIETFLQKYIDEYDGDFGETDMGSALKEWIAHYTSHVQHDPPWDYPDRNYKMWE